MRGGIRVAQSCPFCSIGDGEVITVFSAYVLSLTLK